MTGLVSTLLATFTGRVSTLLADCCRARCLAGLSGKEHKLLPSPHCAKADAWLACVASKTCAPSQLSKAGGKHAAHQL